MVFSSAQGKKQYVLCTNINFGNVLQRHNTDGGGTSNLNN